MDFYSPEAEFITELNIIKIALVIGIPVVKVLFAVVVALNIVKQSCPCPLHSGVQSNMN